MIEAREAKEISDKAIAKLENPETIEGKAYAEACEEFRKLIGGQTIADRIRISAEKGIKSVEIITRNEFEEWASGKCLFFIWGDAYDIICEILSPLGYSVKFGEVAHHAVWN